MKRTKFFARVLLVLSIVLLLFGISTAVAQDELTHVRLGMTPFQDMLAIVVGDEQGIYEQVGLDIEFIHLPYEAVTEAVAAGSLDIGSICETTVVTTWDAFPHQRLGNIFYTFEGSAIMVRPDAGLSTYEENLASMGDHDAALAATVSQLAGLDVLTTKGTDMEMGVGAALAAGGLDISDVNVIDLNPDDGLAAFLTGEADAYLGWFATALPSGQRRHEDAGHRAGCWIASGHPLRILDHCGLCRIEFRYAGRIRQGYFPDAAIRQRQSGRGFWTYYRDAEFHDRRPDDHSGHQEPVEQDRILPHYRRGNVLAAGQPDGQPLLASANGIRL